MFRSANFAKRCVMHQLFDHLHSHRLLGASRRTLDVEEESIVGDYGKDIDDEITSDYDPGMLHIVRKC